MTQIHPPAEDLDVDIRFLLANERTLLAWLRTALTLMAGGVALAQFAGDRLLAQLVGLSLLGLGSLGGVIGYLRFRATGRAIRAGQLPTAGHGPALMTVAIIGLVTAVVTAYFLS
ncbi:membrane protein [Rhizocola hellebori]|uniref:Membrane protein n=1 Tax=Rhizocola hellebori TaxID=1392758 RepID=A0A8J3Q828_9ACTN|nr:DUF202 domain-containing protein [Rhizocola hellebori]GIH05134.1 membrane protein [Rhizocola hellebori]